MHGPAGCLLPYRRTGVTRARPGFTRSDHHLNRFADKPIEITVSIQLSGYFGRHQDCTDPVRNWPCERETGVSRASTTTVGGVNFSYRFAAAA
jgi:hypothetical protein